MNMITNTGNKILDMDAEIPGLGVGKFDAEQMVNIMGFSHMADKYRITYDSWKEDAFCVHTKSSVIKFVRDGRVYSYTPSNYYLKDIVATKAMRPPDDETSNLQECANVQECDNEEHKCNEEQECPAKLNNTIASVAEN